MMEEQIKRCIINGLRDRYRNVGKKGKGVIIGELCERLNIGRKHAIRLLAAKSSGRPRKGGQRGRPGKYQDYEFKQALRLFWKIVYFACGRKLKAALPLWLASVEANRGKYSEDIRSRLISISAPTIDRILRPYRANKGKSFTRPGGFRDEIPIQGNMWNIQIPGYLECDTAAMCGGSLHGEFTNMVTMVDIASLWTETRAVFGKGSNAVFDAIRDIEHNLPFDILGYDADNGGEVLNRHILQYFSTDRIAKGLPPVAVTRSREYQKNDNAYIEQRNDSLVRKFLGYERMEYKELIPLLNYYYAEVVCPLVNHFIPAFKISEKIRVKSRTKRIYAAPTTPYQRLMASPYLSPMKKLKLQAIHNSLDPMSLRIQEGRIRTLIDNALKRRHTQLPLPNNLPSYQLWSALLGPQSA